MNLLHRLLISASSHPRFWPLLTPSSADLFLILISWSLLSSDLWSLVPVLSPCLVCIFAVCTSLTFKIDMKILVLVYGLIINKINKLIHFCWLEEMTNNFQVHTVYSDLLSKVRYQSDFGLLKVSPHIQYLFGDYLSSLPVNKKCISFCLFCFVKIDILFQFFPNTTTSLMYPTTAKLAEDGIAVYTFCK